MKHFTVPKDGGLILKRVPKDILHSYEKIRTEIFADSTEGSEVLAEKIISTIKKHEASSKTPFKLGLTTGASPVSLYKWLTRFYNEGKVSFANVQVFSIDEYYPFSGSDIQSRNYKLHAEFLDLVDIKPENIILPDGTVPEDKIEDYCEEFDRKACGLDLLIVGVGTQGQLGFNDVGSTRRNHTRVVQLTYQNRKKQARNFNGDMAATPKSGITMGLGTMRTAKQVVLLAWGEEKAAAVKAVAQDDIDMHWPASIMQTHENITLYTDETAASLLVRETAPWLLGPCEWTRKFIRTAVVWLSQQVGKPVLKLSQSDYLNNGLAELLEQKGPYSKINIDVFNDLQHTITGWPGGKPNSDDTTRPVASDPFPKKVLIFSPHPDDDIISMGGTFIRLAHQGHDVHVAYETSGNVAVHDDVVLQHMDTANQLGFADKFAEVKAIIDSKRPGEAEPRALLNIKAAIRRAEARAACRSFGLNDNTNAHFLNLPFYESGGIKKNPRTQADVDIIKNLIMELKPDQIYMAGDLADPHGTHRVCTEAALEAVEQLKEEGQDWLNNTNIWLYRGAWMEWELGRVDMAVPLSPEELIEKRHAIYRHLSQKDIVPFPGDDPREFWQRAEERTQNTARQYNDLGMAEYQAIEVFLKLC